MIRLYFYFIFLNRAIYGLKQTIDRWNAAHFYWTSFLIYSLTMNWSSFWEKLIRFKIKLKYEIGKATLESEHLL